MHYRHAFHAGNFADVFKHALLRALIEALARKPAAFAVLETHAGAGRYDLASVDAQKTGEWREGVGRLLELPAPPAALAGYLDAVRALGAPRRYPGSPLIALGLLRDNDRLVLCEKVPATAQALREALGRDRRAVVHERDGYEAHTLLPPKEKRGLVLVDPPFERPDEFDAVAAFLERATDRFANGIHAAWYPLKHRFEAERFERRVARACGRPVLAITFDSGAPGAGRMRACGLLVVNPPFGFDGEAAAIGRALVATLGQGPQSACSVQAVDAASAARNN